MIRLGIICPSEIALRRFLPALIQLRDFKFIGVALANKSEWAGSSDITIKNETKKAQTFISQFGGTVFNSYSSLVNSDQIDAVYLPLPPALHYLWAKSALLAGKHVLIEKPATTLLHETKDLITVAKKNNLAIHENYMFIFHDQINAINKIILSKELGNIRLFRLSFGFPLRAPNDFRYNKQLGGGALLDCGGYTIKYASLLLGNNVKIAYSQSNYEDGFEVDISGSGALINDKGITAQIAFGMNNSYKCDLEIWGSLGCLSTGRIFTAPTGFVPEVLITKGNEKEIRTLPSDDTFKKSIQLFSECIQNENSRMNNYNNILQQALLLDEFIKKRRKSDEQ